MERLLEESFSLDECFDRMWALVRQSKLYGGRPRNASSGESVTVARRALSIAAEAGETRFLAEANSMMAYALNANEEYIESLGYYREAIRAFDEADDTARGARTRLGFITALSVTGQSREALEVGKEAGQFFLEHEDYASQAKLATNLGAVHQRLDDNERAVQYHFEAANLFKRIGDEPALAKAYLNVANTLCFLDRFTESEEMYANCESIAARLGIDDLRAHSLYNKAYLYFLSGRFSEALAVYRDVRPMYLKDGSHRHAALCDLDETEIYVQLRLPHDALLLAQSAAAAFAKLDMPYEQAKAIAFAGVALTQKRQFGDALTAFRESQGLMEQDGNMFWSALLDLYRAEVMFSIGRLWEAHSLASTADQKFKQQRYPVKRLVALLLLGRVSMDLGRMDEAALYARMVQEIAEETKTSMLSFACNALLAEIAEREGRTVQALEFYERSAKEIALRHTHLHHDELGITSYKGKAAIFESLAHLTLALGEAQARQREASNKDSDAPARAYAWCEKAKSQIFVEAIAPHLPTVRSRADEALLARVERLRAELNGSYLRLRPEFLTTPGLPRGEEIEMKEDELVRTLSDLSKSDSEYVSLQTASSVRIEELQESLPADTTVVEYFFARDEVLAFVVTKSRFEVVRHLTPIKRIQFLGGRLQYQLKKFASAIGHGKPEDPSSKGAADELLELFYDELLSPVMPFVQTNGLVIVPHGMLHRVPFHAFRDGTHYVAERYDVSYAPSGSVLKYCLDRLPVIGGAPLTIDDSSERVAAVRQAANASIVHMEVPIAFRQDNPVLSGLEFSDGALCVPDIYSTDWNTNVLSLRPRRASVDLSGNSDDLLCLVRSFLYAGSRSVLFELWNARNEASERFFAGFRSEWLSGKTKRQAMRAVRDTVRAEYPHPFCWAPFVLIGQF